MMVIKKVSIVVMAALVVIPLSCKKAESPSEEAMAPAAMSEPGEPAKRAMSVEEAGAVKDKKAEAGDEVMKADDGRGLQGHFLAPMDLAKERLLEYRVDLTYETKNILASRRALLGIVAKYGFIKGSSAALDERTALVASDVFVKSDKLYETLQELDAVGTLLSENIAVTDHTENMVLQERKVKREQVRMGRRGAAAAQVGGGAKNWNDIENSLSQSEEGLDAAEHAKWQIRDKVAWACIHVNLNGPEQPGRVKVPKYVNAFIGLVNFLLILVYVLIYLAPFAAVAGVIVWKRKEILGIFRRKKE
jgi:hypothetical protein